MNTSNNPEQPASQIPADPRLNKVGTAYQRAGKLTPKYRPSLTAEQIQHILYLAKTEQTGLSSASISLIATLAPFQAKIENAGITAAYTLQPARPKALSLESLGAGKVIDPLSVMSKEEWWEQCYDSYIANPAACSLEMIQAAAEHRYLNDLMTPAEESEHEQK